METTNSQHEKIEALKRLLLESGVDISNWGQGTAKPVEKLQKEIDEGECVLMKNEKGELIRKVSLACVYVYYKNSDGKTFVLKEDRQVFKNGSIGKRTLQNSVTEKMKAGETPLEAAKRGLMEELGITEDFNLKYLEQIEDESEITSSYRGLKSERIKEMFEVTLNDNQYSPDGYQEIQEDKTTYFKWEKVEL